jgi:hypothetical protein
VPGTSTAADWAANSGQWGAGGNTVVSYLDNGQVSLMDSTGLDERYPAQFGNGTYATGVSIAGGANPQAWAGLALTNNGITGSWGTGGYLVFLRANGSVGIYKSGTGQVVADVPTGTSPTTKPVRLRVLKTGANFQVYVNNNLYPFINWTDTSPPAWAIGSFGLANLQAPATFANVTYNGNDAR